MYVEVSDWPGTGVVLSALNANTSYVWVVVII